MRIFSFRGMRLEIERCLTFIFGNRTPNSFFYMQKIISSQTFFFSSGRALHCNSLGLALISLEERRPSADISTKSKLIFLTEENAKTVILFSSNVRLVAPCHFNIRMRSWPCAIVMRFSLSICKKHKTFLKKNTVILL